MPTAVSTRVVRPPRASSPWLAIAWLPLAAARQGRDRSSYIIRPGTKLYNGEVKEILPKKVVFRQQGSDDPKQLNPYQEIVREISD